MAPIGRSDKPIQDTKIFLAMFIVDQVRIDKEILF